MAAADRVAVRSVCETLERRLARLPPAPRPGQPADPGAVRAAMARRDRLAASAEAAALARLRALEQRHTSDELHELVARVRDVVAARVEVRRVARRAAAAAAAGQRRRFDGATKQLARANQRLRDRTSELSAAAVEARVPTCARRTRAYLR